jgi:hypothetical protein
LNSTSMRNSRPKQWNATISKLPTSIRNPNEIDNERVSTGERVSAASPVTD